MESNTSVEITFNQIERSLLSIHDLYLFQVVNYVVIGQIFAVFGAITNIVNMVVFAKIGFKETINVSLFGLAVSDFGACFTVGCWNVAMNPWFNQLKLSFYPAEVFYLTAGWPRNLFVKTTTFITAFITFERCLCVAIPLKVKSVITPLRVKIFLGISYFLVIASHIPVYYANRLGWRWDSSRNESLLGLFFTSDREEVENIVFAVHNSIFSYSALIFITLCTAILVFNLKKKANWRQKTVANMDTSSEVLSKEMRVARMVLIISCLFISAFIPNMVIIIIMSLNPDFSIKGTQANLFLSVISCTMILETINSSMNIFIYYCNSSVYKAMFDKCFRRV